MTNIDQQAREYAFRDKAALRGDEFVDIMRAFVAGATRILTPEEIEAAAEAVRTMQEKSFGWPHDDWSNVDEEVHRHYYRMIKAAFRSVGLRCDE